MRHVPYRGGAIRRLDWVSRPVAFVLFLFAASAAPLIALGPAPLYANGGGGLPGGDTDLDGAGDGLEIQIGTDPAKWDTDGDTFGDMSEYLQHADPLDPAVTPDGIDDLGVYFYEGAGKLNLGLGLHLANGDLAAVSDPLWILIVDGVPYDLFKFFNWGLGSLYVTAAHAPPAQLVSVEVSIPKGLLDVFVGSSMHIVGAAKINGTVLAAGGQILQVTGVWGISPYVMAAGGMHGQQGGSGGGPGIGPGSGTFKPLNPFDVPATWSSGEACVTTMDTVGTSGLMVIYEVTNADCQPFNSYCAPDCASQIGELIEQVDLPGLVGGG